MSRVSQLAFAVLVPLLSSTAMAQRFAFCAQVQGMECEVLWTCPCPTAGSEAPCAEARGEYGLLSICGEDLGGGRFDCSKPVDHHAEQYECAPLGAACNPQSDVCMAGTVKFPSTPAGGVFSFEYPPTLGDHPAPLGDHAACLGDGLDGGFTKEDPACRGAAQNRCPPVGGAVTKGDPIQLSNLGTVHSVVDVRAGGLELRRTYTRDFHTWAYGAPVGRPSEPFVPKPFGSAPDYKGSLRWTHNYFANVTQGSDKWTVRDTSGRTSSFRPCVASPCLAPATADSADSSDALEFDGTAFTLHRDGAPRLVFADGLGAEPRRYFLSRIEDAQTSAPGEKPRLLSQVRYAVPPQCHGEASSPVPYVERVESLEGTALVFHYRLLAGRFGAPECVIDSVGVTAPGQAERLAATYEYAGTWFADGGMDSATAGELLRVSYGPGGMEGDEVYREEPRPSACTKAYWTVARNGVEVIRHGYEPPCGYLTFNRTWDYTQGFQATVANADALTPMPCVGAGCQDAGITHWLELVPPVSPGAGRPGISSWVVSEWVDFMPGVAVREVGGPCVSGQCTGDAVQRWTWAKLPDGPAVNTSHTDPSGARTAWSYAEGTAPAPAGLSRRWELREEKRGLTDAGVALESTRLGYAYLGTAGRRRVSEETQDSVLQPGAAASQLTLYDEATGRQRGTIRSGYTRVFEGESFRTVFRRVGTFSFTSQVCSGGPQSSCGPSSQLPRFAGLQGCGGPTGFVVKGAVDVDPRRAGSPGGAQRQRAGRRM